MKRRSRVVLWILLVTGGVALLLSSRRIVFSDYSLGNLEVGYVFPKSQEEGVSNYFKLKWVPNTTEEVGLTLRNLGSDDLTYLLSVGKAVTARSGTISYEDKWEDPLLPSILEDFPTRVTIPKGEEVTLTGRLSLADAHFEGFKLGGITLREEGTGNSLKYVIPIVIKGDRGGRPDHDLTFGKFSLEVIGVSQYAFVFPIENKRGNWMSGVQAEVEVTKGSNSKTVLTSKQKIELAPESKASYGVTFDRVLPAGEYDVHFSLKTDRGQVWKETQRATISKEKEQEMASYLSLIEKKERETEECTTLTKYFGVVIGAFLLTSVIAIKKGRKSKSDENK